MLPLPDSSATYIDVKSGRPTRDFYNWLRRLEASGGGGGGGNGWPVFNVATTGGDDRALIQEAIDDAGADGGAIVKLGNGVFATTDEIINQYANVSVIGQGGDTEHDGGTGVEPATTLRWDGSSDAAKAILRQHTPSDPAHSCVTGGGATGIAFDGQAACGYGLVVNSVRAARFRNLFVKDVLTSAYHITALESFVDIAESADSQENIWDRCGFRLVDSAPVQAADGFTFAGSGTANSSFNTYFDLFGQHWDGVAFKLIDADNEKFFGCGAYRSGGSGYGWDFKADARTNYLFGCSWMGSIGLIVRTPATPGLAGMNFLLTHDYTNGSADPELEAGASIETPKWLASNPVAVPTSGAFGASACDLRTHRYGGAVHVFGQLNVSSLGTASGDVDIPLPIEAALPGAIGGAWDRSTGDVLYGCYMANTTELHLALGSLTLAADVYNFSITYEGV